MGKSVIRMGDKTSHGGTVISADMTWFVYDKPVARVGDLTVCPTCKGVFPILEGAGDLTSFGRAVAREDDHTACGAVLIASQSSAWWQSTCSRQASENVPVDISASSPSAQDAPTLCLECLATATKLGTALIVRSTDG